jgi:hypothetical protein
MFACTGMPSQTREKNPPPALQLSGSRYCLRSAIAFAAASTIDPGTRTV